MLLCRAFIFVALVATIGCGTTATAATTLNLCKGVGVKIFGIERETMTVSLCWEIGKQMVWVNVPRGNVIFFVGGKKKEVTFFFHGKEFIPPQKVKGSGAKKFTLLSGVSVHIPQKEYNALWMDNTHRVSIK